MVGNLYTRSESGQVSVIALTLPDILDSSEFDELNSDLLGMIDQAPHRNWLLDLSASHYMGSAMLGLMVNLRQRIKAGGGKITLTGLGPKLMDIFRATSLVRLFTIVK